MVYWQKREKVMAENNQNLTKRKKQLGQSLVEAALFLPIFLIIIGGVVEVAQLVVTQNRITDATRASTRFAANGGEDSGMIEVIMTNVTGTVNMQTGSDIASQARWDIWAIRGTTIISGEELLFQEPEEEWLTHIWGGEATKNFDEVTPDVIKREVLNELFKDLPEADIAQTASGLEIVGTYIIYDVNSILGLDATPGLGEIHSVRELIVMRVAGLNIQPSRSCTAFPIAVYSGNRSVGGDSNPFPPEADFDYPSISPPTLAHFFSHQSDKPLTDAREGYVYKVTLGSGDVASQQFRWLQWNLPISGGGGNPITVLSNSLTWPGNSADYQDHGDPGNLVAEFTYPVRGFVEPGNNILDLLQGQLVGMSSAELPDIATAVQNNVDQDRALRMIIYDEVEAATFFPRIAEFAIFRIKGYGNEDGNEWLLLEYVRTDKSCGQNN